MCEIVTIDVMDTPDYKLIVGISSRALFDLEASHEVFVNQGREAYCQYQIEHENDVLAPGVAFNLVRKLLALNTAKRERVEIVLLSHNTADTGLRIFNSIEHHGLQISRAAFSGGRSPWPYALSFGIKLFLSANPDDVRAAIAANCAAAIIRPGLGKDSPGEELRIAFDGDAVLFSDAAERVYREQGLEAFAKSETSEAHDPLPGGPFKPFLEALNRLQAEYDADGLPCPIRTALVTARGAPAHERVIRTLRFWKIRIDEALFLGGREKTEFLSAFQTDIFFDDQRTHIDRAADVVTAGHVPSGIANEPQDSSS